MVTKKFPKSKLTNLWFVYWKNAKIKLIKSHLEIKPIGNEDQDTNKGQRPRMSARNRWLIILNRLKENWVPKKPKTSTTNWSSVVNPKPEVDNHLGEPMVCPSIISLFLRTLFEKSNFFPKIQFWQNPNIFTSFSPQIFFDNFSREIKVVNS